MSNETDYEGCYSPNSDTVKTLLELPETQVYTSKPGAACDHPAPGCQLCQVAQKIKSKISDYNQINGAVAAFTKSQNAISIDNQTGAALGKQFVLSVIAVATPSLNPNSGVLSITLVVVFTPTENVVSPTKDHQRVYCPAIVTLCTKLGGFDEADAKNSSCEWMNYAPESQKRALPQGSSNEAAPTYTVTTVFPKSAVDRVYSSTASTSSNPTGSNIADDTTRTINVTHSSDSSVTRNLLMPLVTALLVALSSYL